MPESVLMPVAGEDDEVAALLDPPGEGLDALMQVRDHGGSSMRSWLARRPRETARSAWVTA
jgi:hypothetical protein